MILTVNEQIVKGVVLAGVPDPGGSSTFNGKDKRYLVIMLYSVMVICVTLLCVMSRVFQCA